MRRANTLFTLNNSIISLTFQFTNMESVMETAARKSKPFGTNEQVSTGTGTLTYVVGVLSSSQSVSSDNAVSCDFGSELIYQ